MLTDMEIKQYAIRASKGDNTATEALFRGLAPDICGSASTTGVKASERGVGMFHQTRLDINGATFAITDDPGITQYGGVKVYDFPVGLITVEGAVISGVLTASIASNDGIWVSYVALGTTIATTGATLVGNEADITAMMANTNASGNAANVVANSFYDSTARINSTPASVYLNFVIADSAEHASGSATFTGHVTLTWANHGV